MEQQAVEVAALVGGAVGRLRKALGLTQAELASAMSRAGFSWHRSTVAELEAGERALRLDELVAVAAYFEIPISFLLWGAGSRLRSVRVGSAELRGKDWLAFITDCRPADERAPAEVRSAIDRIWGGVKRPWAAIWRRSETGRGAQAFLEARQQVLSDRGRFPGPTYVLVGDTPTTITTHVPPWSTEVKITLEPGEPYVARDDAEAEELARQEVLGAVERIAPYKAFRMRGGE